MKPLPTFAVGAILLAATACDLDSQLAPRVELDVVVDGRGMTPTHTDLGYRVEPTHCRVAIAMVEFTTAGLAHARARRGLLDHAIDTALDLAIPTAFAHPGHAAGGEVVGELSERLVFDWRDDGAFLGTATLLAADYNGVNFTFTRAEVQDGIGADDPMLGHTWDIAGVATRGDASVSFEVLLDQDVDRRIIGVPFDLQVDADSDELVGLSLALQDPDAAQTAMDGLDFLALDDDGDGHVVIEPGSGAYNRLRNNLQTHAYYYAHVR